MSLYLYSASKLRNGVEDWREITPQPLQRAVEAVRKDFEEQSWKFGEIMKTGCYPALRKGSSDRARELSLLLEQQLGRPLLRTVDEGQTEPAVFSFYFYRCADLLAGALRRAFFTLRDISLAQSALISGSPIEWAALQAKVLVADASSKIPLWLKCTCDNLFESSDEDIEWKAWRAPRWLCMQPFANPPYDRVKAWRE